MKGRTISPPLWLCMDKKQTTSAMVSDTAAELTASNVEENRRSCRPQTVLTNKLKPSTTFTSSIAIFNEWLSFRLSVHKDKSRNWNLQTNFPNSNTYSFMYVRLGSFVAAGFCLLFHNGNRVILYIKGKTVASALLLIFKSYLSM